MRAVRIRVWHALTRRFCSTTLLALTATAVGCTVTIPEGRFECSTAAECPNGWRCESQRCYRGDVPDGGAERDGGPSDDGGSSDDSGTPDGSAPLDAAAPVCGDGVVQTPEDCDDMGESAGCDLDCTVAGCGDGVRNESAGEACDDGGESLSCDADCTLARCGDAVVNSTLGEDCDDGNSTERDHCGSDCRTNGFTPCPEGVFQCDAAFPGQKCTVYSIPAVSVCLAPCTTTADCPSVPVGTAAELSCEVLGNGDPVCFLACTSSSECPAGMVCRVNVCAWPT